MNRIERAEKELAAAAAAFRLNPGDRGLLQWLEDATLEDVMARLEEEDKKKAAEGAPAAS